MENKDYYDCHGGPGTTLPACGSCISCLILEKQNIEYKLLKSDLPDYLNKKIADPYLVNGILNRIKEILANGKIEFYKVLKQEWVESERGWGQSFDSYTYHKNEDALKAYIKEYWKAQPKGPAPNCYIKPSGDPETVEVEKEIFDEICKSKNGIRIYK